MERLKRVGVATVDAIHRCHEVLILVASLIILFVTSYSFYIEASTRDVTPLEWLYYPLGAMLLILPNKAASIIRAMRGIPDGNPVPKEDDPVPQGGN